MESPRKSDELPEVFELTRLRDLCREFINENKISNPTNAFIVACGSAKASEFIESICELIGYYGEER